MRRCECGLDSETAEGLQPISVLYDLWGDWFNPFRGMGICGRRIPSVGPCGWARSFRMGTRVQSSAVAAWGHAAYTGVDGAGDQAETAGQSPEGRERTRRQSSLRDEFRKQVALHGLKPMLTSTGSLREQ